MQVLSPSNRPGDLLGRVTTSAESPGRLPYRGFPKEVDEASFWSGAAAAIAGGLITGAFALGVGWITARTEARRQLAHERRSAYADLLTSLDRLIIDLVSVESELRATGSSPELLARTQPMLIQFREAFYTAQIVASPRMLGLVRRIDGVSQMFSSFLKRDDLSLDRLIEPVLKIMYQVPAVFADEARYEVEIGEAGWLRQRRLRKVDPSEQLRRRLDAAFDEILKESGSVADSP